MAKLVINNFRGGMAPEYWQDVNTIKVGKENQFAYGLIDAISNPNVIQATNSSFSNLTGATLPTSGIATKFQMVDDYTSSFSSIPQIYVGIGDELNQINSNTLSLSNTTEFPYKLAPAGGTHSGHTGFYFDDLAVYQLNGVPALWAFYRDNTDGDATIYNLDDTFTTNDVGFSGATDGAVLDNDYPIIAEVADNGFMYVANGNAIHKVDGTSEGGASATVTQSVIDIGAEWMILDIKDYNAKLIILAQEGEGTIVGNRRIRVYVWDRTSTSLSFEDIIRIDGITGSISRIGFYNNIPCVLTVEPYTKSSNIVKLRAFTGRSFDVVRELFPVSSSWGLGVRFDNMKVPFIQWENGIIIITGSGQFIYIENPLTEYSTANYIGNHGVVTGDGSDGYTIGGLIQTTVGPYILFPYYDVDEKETKISSWIFGNTSGTATGDFYTRVYELPKLSDIKGITVYYEPLSSEADKNITITAFRNMSSSAVSGTSMTINYASDGTRGWKYFQLGGGNWHSTSSIQLRFQYPSGETIANSLKITRIEVEYEPTTKVK
jgi:hypothetical protein